MNEAIHIRKLLTFVLCFLSLPSENFASEKKPEIEVDINGFIRVDYGNGDRYNESQGEDVLGSSRSALSITGKYENIKGVFVVGAESLTIDNGSQDDNTALMQDAFITFENFFNQITIKAGAQPLLFGLKPNGYAFDHSLVESIEYGAAGAFAVSNQAGPSVITQIMFSEQVSLDLGVFDLDTAGTNDFDQEGSTIVDNGFIQLRFKDLFGFGVYGVTAVESRYVADTNERNLIVDLGIGIKFAGADISVEWIRLENQITSTLDDESYIIVESYVNIFDYFGLYADYASADQLDVETIRIGADRQYSTFAKFSMEYAGDFSDNDELDADSINIRVAITF